MFANTIKNKLISIIMIFVFFLIVCTSLALLAMIILSTGRAYVGGEGIWSKAQKDAHSAMTLYILTEDQKYFEIYLSHLNPIEGDRLARLELEKSDPDFSKTDSYFIKGGNNPGEVRNMGYLFKYGKNIFFFKNAIAVWHQGDEIISQYKSISEEIHRRILKSSLSLAEKTSFLEKINKHNNHLSQIEIEFSNTLGDASRWLIRILFSMVISFSLLLVTFGTLISSQIARSILSNIGLLVKATQEIAKGNLEFQIDSKGSDELSKLASSFNLMAANLKKVKNELEENQVRAIESTKMVSLGVMAGGIAHEINNPLAIISVQCQQLNRLIEGENLDRSQFKRKINIITETILRASRIVKSLRLFARDSRNDEMSPTKVRETIETTLALCQEKLKNTGVEIRYNSSENVDVEILCRTTEISQILLNFIHNSTDAIEKIQSKWIAIDSQIQGHLVQIRITDSGPGIPLAIQEKLMQPFFTTKEPGKGTGLGLSISFGLAKAHGGRIFIDKNCEHTRFILEIPINQNSQKNQIAS